MNQLKNDMNQMKNEAIFDSASDSGAGMADCSEFYICGMSSCQFVQVTHTVSYSAKNHILTV